jgi:uncharacterized protein (UPF0335 family)
MAEGSIAADELRLLIERIERLEEEKKAIADDVKDVYGEAKSRGYDPKTIREIIKLRKMEPAARREREALIDTYKAALGMLDGTPLGKWAIERLTKPDEKKPEDEPGAAGPAANDTEEAHYLGARAAVIEQGIASTSWLQRTLHIGYNKAVSIMERLEREGVVSAPDEKGKRTVLATATGEAPEAAPAEPTEPPLTVDDAHRMGAEAAKAGQPVTANPFPAFDDRRAAWDEAWCAALGSDGMDIPDELKPSPKAKKPEPKGGGDE